MCPYRSVLLALCCFQLLLPSCQENNEKNKGPEPANTLKATSKTKADSDAKVTNTDTDTERQGDPDDSPKSPSPESQSPPANQSENSPSPDQSNKSEVKGLDIQNVLISLLPPNLQDLFLLGVKPDKVDMARLGFRLQKAIATGRLAPVIDDIWTMLMDKRDEHCSEYFAVDGPDCGCDELLEDLDCRTAHILPPEFSRCEIVKQEQGSPKLAYCVSKDYSFFRVAFLWHKALLIKDWPPNILKRMKKMDREGEELCDSRKAFKKCLGKCDPEIQTYDECVDDCIHDWDEMYDDAPDEEPSAEDENDELENEEDDYEKVDRCKRKCPSVRGEYHDCVEILDSKMTKPGIFSLTVNTLHGLDDAKHEPSSPPVEVRKVVLREPLLADGEQSPESTDAKWQEVKFADLQVVSNVVEHTEEYGKCGKDIDFQDEDTKIYRPNENLRRTQLVDVLLSRHILPEDISKNLPRYLKEKIRTWYNDSLSKSSPALFEQAMENHDDVQLKTLLSGIEIRLGRIPPKLVLQYLAEESESESTIDHANEDSIDHCKDLDKKTFTCKPFDGSQMLLCHALGESDTNASSGEAWLVGIDEQGFPVVKDWLKSDKVEELVPIEQIRKWPEQLR